MACYGIANKIFLEQEIQSGQVEEAQIHGADIDGILPSNVQWHKSNVTETNANNAIFTLNRFQDCILKQSSFMRSRFINTDFTDCSMNGLTLIKTIWRKVRLERNKLCGCTMQRAELQNVTVKNSSFTDFEGISVKMNNCFFYGCSFETTYGSGMNGFSGAEIANCVFYQCHFSGEPLNGATVCSCAFIGCSGDTGCEVSTYTERTVLEKKEPASILLRQFSGRKIV